MFNGDARLPIRPMSVYDLNGDTTSTRLRLLVEPEPAIVWTTDCDLVFRPGLGSGHASFGLRPTPGTSLFDYYGTRDRDAVPIRAHLLALDGESVSYQQTGRAAPSRPGSSPCATTPAGSSAASRWRWTSPSASTPRRPSTGRRSAPRSPWPRSATASSAPTPTGGSTTSTRSPSASPAGRRRGRVGQPVRRGLPDRRRDRPPAAAPTRSTRCLAEGRRRRAPRPRRCWCAATARIRRSATRRRPIRDRHGRTARRRPGLQGRHPAPRHGARDGLPRQPRRR